MDELFHDIKMYSAYLSDRFRVSYRLSISFDHCLNIFINKYEDFETLDYFEQLKSKKFKWEDIKYDVIPLIYLLNSKYGIRIFMIDGNHYGIVNDNIEPIDDDKIMNSFNIIVNIEKK